ncbi:MAG: carbohydrate kinase family protein [Clostridiales bacterium]|nr:carbohydrate kinase family protein [Clostridiales bacterium]
MERNGIAVAGNILTDNIKMIEEYPKKGMLVTITDQSLAIGGCVPNTGIDLKKLDKSLIVKAYGKVGDDVNGKFALDKMSSVGIDVSNVKVTDQMPTSYSDVMTVNGTGERTFFHHRGANKIFSMQDIDLDNLDCKIFHIGYLMLLDQFDKIEQDGRTPMSKLLEKVREKGIKTSIDIVSESSGNFQKVVSSTLPYCDYVIINEIEAGQIAGISPRNQDDSLNEQNVFEIMKKLMKMGINEKLIVHCPEKGFSLDKNDNFVSCPSRKLPKGFIKGSVGAGDAFCAGCLYSLYNEYPDDKMLDFSNLVAINCLSEPDSISGVCEKENLLKVLEKQL